MVQSLSLLPQSFLSYGHSLSALDLVSENFIYLSTLSIISPFGSVLSWEALCTPCRAWAAPSPLYLSSLPYFISHLLGIPALQALAVSSWSSLLCSYSWMGVGWGMRAGVGGEGLTCVRTCVRQKGSNELQQPPLFINLSRWLETGLETACVLSLYQTFVSRQP